MISTKALLHCLIVLISLDIVLTLIMVGYMGATEMNIGVHILGFWGFMVLKTIVSAVGVFIIYTYCLPTSPLAVRGGAMLMVGVYGMVFASNAYQIVGAVA